MAKVRTGKVRFAYCNIAQPRALTEGQEPKYSICLIIPKDDKRTIAAINKAIEEAKEEGKASKWGGKIPANLKTPLRDGDAERPDQPEFKNSYFINATSLRKPGVVDRQRNLIDNDEVYSGAYGRASLNLYPYSVGGNRGIAAGLNALQFLHDGEPLGGRVDPQSEFDEWEDDEDDLLG